MVKKPITETLRQTIIVLSNRVQSNQSEHQKQPFRYDVRHRNEEQAHPNSHLLWLSAFSMKHEQDHRHQVYQQTDYTTLINVRQKDEYQLHLRHGKEGYLCPIQMPRLKHQLVLPLRFHRLIRQGFRTMKIWMD